MNSTVVQAVLLMASLAAAGAAAGRWLRVVQREGYRSGSAVEFARRWWSIGPNRVLGAAAVVGLVGAAAKVAPAGLATAAAVGLGPFGLRVRGRSSRLVWTRRLAATAVASALLAVVVLAASEALVPGWRVAAAAATLLAVAVPLLVDCGARLSAPLRRRPDHREQRDLESAEDEVNALACEPHRRQVATGPGGVTVIDDASGVTPSGAEASLGLLMGLAGDGSAGRRVVVTPGLVGLGEAQDEENQRFAAAAAAAATDLVVVGHTNAPALIAGWRQVAPTSRARLVRLAERRHAEAWVARQLGAGDVVLYENDLPDHFP